MTEAAQGRFNYDVIARYLYYVDACGQQDWSLNNK